MVTTAERQCVVCDSDISDRQQGAVYCSIRCMDRSHRERYNANLEASREERQYHLHKSQLSARSHSRARDARKLNQTGVVSTGITASLFLSQQGQCAFCLTPLGTGFHLDHIVPLSRGGLHDDSNLQLLCPPCNMSKGARDPVEFAQAHGRLF